MSFSQGLAGRWNTQAIDQQIGGFDELIASQASRSQQLAQLGLRSSGQINARRDRLAAAEAAEQRRSQQLAGYGKAPTPGFRPYGNGAIPGGDRDILAKTIEAEARGEGGQGMLAVGAVINNRLKSGRWGNDLNSVIMADGQFSAWNGVTGYANGQGGLDMANMKVSPGAYAAADAILSGNYTDPSQGALNYYNPSVASPKWGPANPNDWLRIGNHIFGNA